eukprot:532831_1
MSNLTITNPEKANTKTLHIGRHSSPIMTLTPGYGKGKTPLWNTFESMEIDFDIDDLSDDEDEDEDELAMTILQDYDNYAMDDDAFLEAQNQQLKNTTDEKTQDLTIPKKTTARASVPPSAILNIGSNNTKQKQSKNEKISLKNSSSVLAPPRSRAKNVRRHSMPIKKIKHYHISGLTIWSNHKQDLEDLYMKEALSKANKRKSINRKSINRKSINRKSTQIKFKDMENIADIDAKDMDIEIYEDEEENVRRYLIGEIIETEESYVKGMNTLLHEFIIPMFDQKLIKRKYKEIITCNIPEILLFHTQFLEQLVDATTVDFDNKMKKSVSLVFYELCNNKFVEMYTQYIRKYHNMLDVYAIYNKSKKLQKYLKNKRKEKKPLTNHLILPIQRVTRYLLLLEELKKNTSKTHKEYNELEAVIGKILETVNMINERQREIENMSQCLQVQETMSGLNRNIVEKNRKLLAQFLFRKSAKQRGRQFFLFNDLLIITNTKLKVKTIIVLRTIDIKKVPKSDVQFHLFSIKHEAIYETDKDRIDELNEFMSLIENNRKHIHQESLMEIGANDIATLLSGTYSVSQGNLFRKQLSGKNSNSAQPSLTLSNTSFTDSI